MAGAKTRTRWARDADGATKPFLEHLEDLRKTIIWSAFFLVIGMAVVAPFAPQILWALERPVSEAGLEPRSFLKILHGTAGFSIAWRIMFWGGLIVSSPFILTAIAWFVFPGLKPTEKRAVLKAMAVATFLFIGGVCMGYFFTLPVAVRMLVGIIDWLREDAEAVWILMDYISFALKLLLAFGLAFQFPVVVVALGSLGIITPEQLRDKRRHVIVGLLVLSMFLTPQDPITMILMAGPLIVLYEVCILYLALKARGRGK